MQAMFIDVDGTLSSPCYKVNGKFTDRNVRCAVGRLLQ